LPTSTQQRYSGCDNSFRELGIGESPMSATDAGLDRERSLKFLWGHCESRLRPDGRLESDHAEEVADRCHRYCLQYFEETSSFVRPLQRITAEAVWHAGLFHELLERYDVSYDEICRMTNVEVADTLCGASRDTRLPRPRRVLSFLGQLQEAGPLSQIVVLGDTIDELAAMKANPVLQTDESRDWLMEVGETLNALHLLRPHESMRRRMAIGCQVARRMVESIEEEASRAYLAAKLARKKAAAQMAENLQPEVAS